MPYANKLKISIIKKSRHTYGFFFRKVTFKIISGQNCLNQKECMVGTTDHIEYGIFPHGYHILAPFQFFRKIAFMKISYGKI